MGTVFLIFLLLVLCGFIAYIGDLLGRRFGKKRLSLFNLRPKHTAIVLTVATGVLIAAVTLCVALVSVPGFREVVTKGERLANQNRRLASKNQALAQENDQRQRENASLESRNVELTTTTRELREEKGRLTETNRKLGGQNRALSKQNQAFQSQNRKLQGENRTLAGQNKGLQSENRSLLGTNRNLEQINRGLTSRNSRLSAANVKLQAAQKGLQGEVKRLGAEAESLSKTVSDYREAAYVYRRDDEIARRVIPPNASEEFLQQTIGLLLFDANQEVRRRSGLMEGTKALIRLVAHRQHPQGMTQDQARLAQWAVQEARRLQNEPVVVRVVAHENGVRGRSIAARLECYPNNRVFRRDQAVAETRVVVLETTGNRTRSMVTGRILADLIYFLQNEVGPAATSANMIPSNEAVGELGYDELLPVCERIYELGQSGHSVRVVAKASRDILRAGPLLIWLDVEPQRTAVRSR